MAIVGKPNVGKSTLLNALIGAKVSIVSDKPQTTRNRIAAIANLPGAQIVFLDTPGIHKPRHGLGERMISAAKVAMQEVDLILFVADASTPVTAADRAVIGMLEGLQTPLWLVLNKIDAVAAERVEAIQTELESLGTYQLVRRVSATNGQNMEGFAQDIADVMPEGPMYYPLDTVIDRPEEFIVSELVREKLLLLTREEIPHSVAVVVDRMVSRDDRDIVDIDASILVERDSQKGIVIGAGGRVLREVGTLARTDIEHLLGSQVNLQLWVKVRRRWRDDESMLNRLGYRE